ncbi:3-oxoacyl-[acyl-carrier-protein] reductase FabG [Pseudocercospora fuligena]|uniref:3-oxoacyl-[acyl-carrier-protein] reductase FabG n=1 Tax=Pseudocercospora fuligena TaxID=685502 RepID=A0A8H6R8D8_9PEZI|nr:3-oxoacyl-[acyl-carrier-protein] reductase FabG [Pseudocercospora fuligena]
MSASKGAFLVPSDLPKQFDVYPFIATERFAGKLKGKIVVVVGASTGIGKATALAFAAAGASLALVARRKTLLDELVAEIEYRYQSPATAIQADIVNEDTPRKIISETESNLGGQIDILINNAAQHLFGRFHDLDFSTWWSRMETSFKAPLAITHTVLREVMIPRKSGIIINITSTSGAHDIPFQTAYSIPKTAMLKLHQNLSWELEPYNILTFSVHPGNVMTEMVQDTGKQSQEYFAGLPKEAMTEKVAGMFGRYQGIEWQKPELAANTIVTLCSEERCKVLDGRYVDSEQDLEKVLQAAESGRVEKERLYYLKVDQV